jgi:hypothetical protein
MIQFVFKTTVLLVAFGCMAFVGYGVRKVLFPPEETVRGAELQVMCQKCGHVEVARVTQIRTCFCSKCGSHVGEAWRCRECRKTFPFVLSMPKDRAAGKRGLQDWAEMHRCPHCRSLLTEPVPMEGDNANPDAPYMPSSPGKKGKPAAPVPAQ